MKTFPQRNRTMYRIYGMRPFRRTIRERKVDSRMRGIKKNPE